MKRVTLLVVSLLFIMTATVFGHPGGTDSSGGHHDYNNASGLGDYHYHHGYGPHLHDGGVCPYDEPVATYNEVDYSDETYTFTEDELHDFISDEIATWPEEYDVVSLEEYEQLEHENEKLEKELYYQEEANDNSTRGIIITAILGIALSCYVYKRRDGEYDKGYKAGYSAGCSKSSDKIIYCRVSFRGNDVYYYRTNDKTIKVGDTVIVPTGKNNIESEAVVKSVNEYSENSVPYPLDKTKHIIRKL